MRIKTNFFWFYTLLIVALFITIVLRSFPLPLTAIVATVGPHSSAFEIGVFGSLVKESGLDEILSLVTQYLSKPQYQWRDKKSCDEKKWDSKLISLYNVSLTLTVDLKGCANFSSVQTAVDAVPDYGSSRTLILINSGVYRSLSSITHSNLPTTLILASERAVKIFCFQQKFLSFYVILVSLTSTKPSSIFVLVFSKSYYYFYQV